MIELSECWHWMLIGPSLVAFTPLLIQTPPFLTFVLKTDGFETDLRRQSDLCPSGPSCIRYKWNSPVSLAEGTGTWRRWDILISSKGSVPERTQHCMDSQSCPFAAEQTHQSKLKNLRSVLWIVSFFKERRPHIQVKIPALRRLSNEGPVLFRPWQLKPKHMFELVVRDTTCHYDSTETLVPPTRALGATFLGGTVQTLLVKQQDRIRCRNYFQVTWRVYGRWWISCSWNGFFARDIESVHCASPTCWDHKNTLFGGPQKGLWWVWLNTQSFRRQMSLSKIFNWKK